METLTKAWLYETDRGRRQRTVSEMVDDRLQFGTSGNCFDLAVWLLHAFEIAGIDAYAIGHDLLTPNAHVAVLAVDNGYRYLCDLGDQWIAPILIDSASADFTRQPVSGFVTGGRVKQGPFVYTVADSQVNPNTDILFVVFPNTLRQGRVAYLTRSKSMLLRFLPSHFQLFTLCSNDG